MNTNTHPTTGIRYGIISADALHYDVITDIQSRGADVHWEGALEDLRREVEKDEDVAPEDREDEIEYRTEAMGNSWYDDEPVHEFHIDGVHGRTTWLGGALLVWIFESPHTTKANLCSPCVPNCGDLDNLNPNGYECYTVPAGWLRNEE